MGIVSFAGVTLAYMVLWFVAAGRIVRADNGQEAARMYQTALGKAGPAYGVFALWSFGVRLDVNVAAVVSAMIEFLSTLL